MENDKTGRLIIGLCGLAGSGKSVIGDYLCTKYHFKSFAFAKDLKEILYRTRGISTKVPLKFLQEFVDNGYLTEDIVGGHFYAPFHTVIDILGDEKAKREIPNVRNLYQTFGTEGMQTVLGQDVWSNNVLRKIDGTLTDDPNSNIVVTDVRFYHEFSMLKSIGGLTIEIVRDNQDINAVNSHHSSEVIDFEPDKKITNNGTIENVYEKIDNLLSELKPKITESITSEEGAQVQ